MDFSEIILVYDIEVGRCSQLNEYMNIYSKKNIRSIEAKFHILYKGKGRNWVTVSGFMPYKWKKKDTLTSS